MEESAALRERAASEAAAEVEAARAQGKEMVGEAQAVRERLLGDLARRRRLAHVQIEQLRAGPRAPARGVPGRAAHARRGHRGAHRGRGRGPRSRPRPRPGVPRRRSPSPRRRRWRSSWRRRRSWRMRTARPRRWSTSPPSDVIAADETAAMKPTRADRTAEASGGPPACASSGQRRRPRRGRRRGACSSRWSRPPTTRACGCSSTSPPSRQTAPSVDEIFSRMRAERETAAARPTRLPEAAVRPAAPATARAAPTATAGTSDRTGDDEVEAEPTASDADETALQRRDEVLEPLGAQLVRKLKRALQDEQNEVLDRLRTARGTPQPDVVLLSVVDQARRYRDVAEPLLARAAEAGVRSVTGGDGRRRPARSPTSRSTSPPISWARSATGSSGRSTRPPTTTRRSSRASAPATASGRRSGSSRCPDSTWPPRSRSAPTGRAPTTPVCAGWSTTTKARVPTATTTRWPGRRPRGRRSPPARRIRPRTRAAAACSSPRRRPLSGRSNLAAARTGRSSPRLSAMRPPTDLPRRRRLRPARSRAGLLVVAGHPLRPLHLARAASPASTPTTSGSMSSG